MSDLWIVTHLGTLVWNLFTGDPTGMSLRTLIDRIFSLIQSCHVKHQAVSTKSRVGHLSSGEPRKHLSTSICDPTGSRLQWHGSNLSSCNQCWHLLSNQWYVMDLPYKREESQISNGCWWYNRWTGMCLQELLSDGCLFAIFCEHSFQESII